MFFIWHEVDGLKYGSRFLKIILGEIYMRLSNSFTLEVLLLLSKVDRHFSTLKHFAFGGKKLS